MGAATTTPARVLVVAGSDSTGGAGVDADRDALDSIGVSAAYVVTAWTEQFPDGVRELGAVAPELWLLQARSYITTSLAALKIGLLPGPGAVQALALLLEGLDRKLPVVFDPVLSSSSGTRFHAEHEIASLLDRLLPLGMIWTPNLPELAQLGGVAEQELAQSPASRVAVGEALLEGGARAVVIKGGHGTEDPALDLVLEAGQPPVTHGRPRLPGAAIRGSGCRFASALAGNLALGAPLGAAVGQAGDFVAKRLSMPGS